MYQIGKKTSKNDGRVALVTGATGGLGRETALAFSHQGWRTFVAGRDKAGIERLVADIRADGGVSEGVSAARLDRTEAGRIVESARESFGRIDLLVNNAGISCGGNPLEEVTEEEWDEVIDRSLKSVFLFSQAGAAAMRKQGGGCIINVSLHAGRKTSLFAGSHHAAAKAGIIGFSRQLGKDLSKEKIRVRAVGLSLVYAGPSVTPLWDLYHEDELAKFIEDIPAGRLVSDREAATAVVSLASCDPGRFDAAFETFVIGWGR